MLLEMSCSKGAYISGVLKGLQSVLIEAIKLQDSQCRQSWNNSIIKNAAEQTAASMNEKLKGFSQLNADNIDKNVSEILQRSSMVLEGLSAVVRFAQVDIVNKQFQEYDVLIPPELTFNADIGEEPVNKSVTKSKPIDVPKVLNESDVVTQHESRLKLEVAAVMNPQSQLQSGTLRKRLQTIAPPSLEVETTSKIEERGLNFSAKKPKKLPSLSEKARERAVPASRIARVVSFGTLAAGLGIGTIAEVTRRTLGLSDQTSIANTLDNAFITPANAERIVNTLCKVRGAALKIGQIFSIQDNNILSPEFQRLFERVRQSADFMPKWQVENVLKTELGNDWRTKFSSFEMKPFAAASIGQVHCGTLVDGSEVAIKIQYPGVAKGIESDIDNLMSVLKIWNVFPQGMYIDNLVEVAKKELAWEVDYIREAECTKKFKKLLEPYHQYYVPKVIDDLCTSQVFTTELIEGVPVDKCADMDFETRCYISKLIMDLLLMEMFEFRYMQTDPNWSNFFYNPTTKQLILLDFGASRSYDKKFMDQYLRVVKAAVDGDREKVLTYSLKMGFLTGYESKIMKEAHVDAVMILGEILCKEGFDFGVQNTISRIQTLVPTIIHHRLCPPPEEVYSLHRKLSGAFLLYTKLKAKLSCHSDFMRIYNQYSFDET